jgi:hypothetical protein
MLFPSFRERGNPRDLSFLCIQQRGLFFYKPRSSQCGGAVLNDSINPSFDCQGCCFFEDLWSYRLQRTWASFNHLVKNVMP